MLRVSRLPAVYGEWVQAEKTMAIPDPLNGEPFIQARAWLAYRAKGCPLWVCHLSSLPVLCPPFTWIMAGTVPASCCRSQTRSCTRWSPLLRQ